MALPLSFLALHSAGAQDKPDKTPPPRDESAIDDPRVQHRTYKFEAAGGIETPYALFVPSTYDSARPAPLMVALHGLGRQYDWLMGYHGMLDLAERDGFIVTTPLGHDRRGWFGSHENGETGRLSELDVMNVVGLIRDEFNVDADRIYLWGHSMGGAGTYHLAAKYPDLWAGLGVAAPAPSVDPDQLERFQHLPISRAPGRPGQARHSHQGVGDEDERDRHGARLHRDERRRPLTFHFPEPGDDGQDLRLL